MARSPDSNLLVASSLRSRRNPALRLFLSGPWHAKQFSDRIGRISRLNSMLGFAVAAIALGKSARPAVARSMVVRRAISLTEHWSKSNPTRNDFATYTGAEPGEKSSIDLAQRSSGNLSFTEQDMNPCLPRFYGVTHCARIAIIFRPARKMRRKAWRFR